MRNAHNILAENPEWEISYGKPRHRWEYNIELDLKGIRGEDLEWICLA
jgi:hypothetical protein